MAVNIELTDHAAVNENRYDNFRFGFERAGQVSRIFAHIIDHHRLPAGSSRPADSLVQWNAGMRRHRAFECPQDKYRWLRARLEQIKTHPVVLQHTVV